MATTATSSTGLSLNPSAFLNLFVTQLQYQDPTAPMDPSQMTTVLAQLTTVQDLSNLQTSFQQSLADGMIGDQVTYTSTAQRRIADRDGDGVAGPERDRRRAHQRPVCALERDHADRADGDERRARFDPASTTQGTAAANGAQGS